MRKRLVVSEPLPHAARGPEHWLDLEPLVRVEVTSEDSAHPIEHALVPGREAGWRAAEPGPQTIRLLFDQPQRLRRIALAFEEAERERSQEFVLLWQPVGQGRFLEIVRQQWNFSPPGTTREVEDYRVELVEAAALELRIVPDRSGGPARASLAEWRLA